MTYNFDKWTERRGTGALKWDALQERFGEKDLLPLWVADMDFETPPFIMDALRQRLEHPVLGYTLTPTELWPTVAQWIESHHGWKVETDWLTFIPGVVKGIGMVINLFVKEDEKVIIQPPVYHPFRLTTLGNGRQIVNNPLRRHEDGHYSMDFEGLERVTDSKCKLLILSNPHNPGGTVWDKDTLTRLAQFCHSRGILVISDEIHCDILLYNHCHTPFASVSPEAQACSITFGAPSKTFNMAGVVSSYAIVPNAELRERFFGWLSANELNEPTLFAPIATLAAFTQGEEWRRQMVSYIEGNVDLVMDFCRTRLQQVKPLRPQASYLMWLDCRTLGLPQPQLVDLFVHKAGLALNDGSIFGREGEGYMRLNVASPRSMVLQALEQLEAAIRQL
ncbi:MAG: PatB family C-S lyase [Bacteroides sp.]|nr:PatB family C-S lyase [Bacteroides sp.]